MGYVCVGLMMKMKMKISNFKFDCNGLRFVYIVDEMFGDLNYKFGVACVVIDGDRMSKRCAPL